MRGESNKIVDIYERRCTADMVPLLCLFSFGFSKGD
jgi:hypothetical protein